MVLFRSSRFFRILLILILSSALLASAAFPRMGAWLVIRQDLEPADAIIILMGSTTDRVLEALDLYQEDMAETFIMVQTRQYGEEHVKERGLDIPTPPEISAMVLAQAGVPDENILILPGSTTSTIDEARAVAGFIEDQPGFESVILVTSSYHTRRALMIFERELGKMEREVTIMAGPSRYSEYQADEWYRDRDSAKWTVLEYMKMAGMVFDWR